MNWAKKNHDTLKHNNLKLIQSAVKRCKLYYDKCSSIRHIFKFTHSHLLVSEIKGREREIETSIIRENN